jgi:hypothetical protein
MRVIGLGLGVLSLVFAMACGDTQNHGKPGAAAGNGGSAGDTPAAGSGGKGAADGGGTDSGGADSAGGGPDASAGEGGQPVVVDLPERIELVRDQVPNKLDLLLMIDNSISMQDKQQLLADAMQHLVDRLVQPRCLDVEGVPTGEQASALGVCPVGSHPEFLPFADIHAAVVTSSLGSRGAAGTTDVCVSADDDDHARLIGSIRPGLESWNNSGFLVWDPEQQLTPPGINAPADFAAALAETVEAAGDSGCGYEAVLEAWYRFLIDPEPPSSVLLVGNQGQIQGTSAEVLAEREAFLRSDSVLAIVMLSDENDCSVIDEGYGWLIHRSAAMYRSTSQCATNPNDPCCQSCGETAATGCPPIAEDSACVAGGEYLNQTANEDDLNLRCYRQKQRFGFDLLYPIQRYVNALTMNEVPRRSDGAMVPNPIYVSRDGKPPRSPEQVLLLGIVGVPWQDVAHPDSIAGDGLRFLSEDGALPPERWSVILGEPDASPPVLATDPFMYETPIDRTTIESLPQANPIVPEEVLVAAGSTDPRANAINGHESVNVANRDLQYACTFELAMPLTCDQAALESDQGCDCFDDDLVYQRSLCHPKAGGAVAITQTYGKAYPGLRELQVLKGVGGHGIVASACPKSADLASASYGYRPAMDALAGRVAGQVGRSCLVADAEAGPDGRTACQLITAAASSACACDAQQGLSEPEARAAEVARDKLESVGYCTGAECDALCFCELTELEGAELEACQTEDEPPNVPGFCYLNAVPGEAQAGDADLAAECVGAAPRRIRFAGGAPAESSIALLYCPD